MKTLYVSLKQMAEDKALDGVGKVTTYAVDPLRIRKSKPGVNRPLDLAHVRALADAWKRGAVFPPLDVAVEDGEIVVVDGQHRHEGALLAISEGTPIRTIECRQFRGNEEDKVVLQISSQDNLKMSPVVLCGRYAKLVSWGWSVPQIAERTGKTAQHVRDTLALVGADTKTRDMLEKGQVSADVVRTTLRVHKGAAGDVLAADLEKAQAAGKTKVTAATASVKAPSRLATALELLGRLKDWVDEKDGTSVEAEALVDDYRKFLGITE